MSNASGDSIIILHGLPASTLIGIDLLSLNSAPRFHGLSNVPPGPHFLYSAATAALSIRHGYWLFILPSSLYVFRWASETETLQPAPEALVETYRAKVADHKSLLNQGLFPYAQPQPESKDGNPIISASAGDFARLSSRVTEHLVKRIITTSNDAHDGENSLREMSSTSCASKDRERIPGLTAQEVEDVVGGHGELTFTDINLKQTWRIGAVGRERTDAARDRSWALEEVVRLTEGRDSDGREPDATENGKSGKEKSPISPKSPKSEESPEKSQQQSREESQEKSGAKSEERAEEASKEESLMRKDDTRSTWGIELLGEMQFTFLMILTLANYSCLEQWKRILTLVLTSGANISRHMDFFADFLSLLRLQLAHGNDVEDGLFDVADGGGDYLMALLKTFKRNLEEHVVQGQAERVLEELEDLEAWLKAEWNWDLSAAYLRKGVVELEDGERVELEMDEMRGEDERGEYAPIVVELV